jgi:MFS family permease
MLSERNKAGFHYGYLIVVACCALCLAPTTLSFNTAGIFFTPVSTELGVGKGQFGFYMTVQYLAMTFAMPFAGRILAKYDARAILTACVLLVAGSLMAMSGFAELYQFYIAGFLIGVANSVLLYLMVPTLIDRWFKDKVGLFVGLCLAFTGIGGIIFNPIGGYLIDTFGWRTGYFAFGTIAAAVGLPFTIFVIRSFPGDKGLQPYRNTASGRNNGAEAGIAGISMSTALKSPALYFLAVYAGMMDIGITLNYYIPSYAGSLGLSITLASTVAAAVMIGQMSGKILLGYINDMSVKAGMTAAVGSGIIGIGAMALFGTQGIWILYAGAFMFGIFFAGATVTTSLMTRGIFGSRDYSQIFSVVAMVASFCAAFSAALWGFIIDFTGSYTFALGIGVLLMVITFFIGYASLKLGDKLLKGSAPPIINRSCLQPEVMLENRILK